MMRSLWLFPCSPASLCGHTRRRPRRIALRFAAIAGLLAVLLPLAATASNGHWRRIGVGSVNQLAVVDESGLGGGFHGVKRMGSVALECRL